MIDFWKLWNGSSENKTPVTPPPNYRHTDYVGQTIAVGSHIVWSRADKAGFIEDTVAAMTPKKIRLTNGNLVDPTHILVL